VESVESSAPEVRLNAPAATGKKGKSRSRVRASSKDSSAYADSKETSLVPAKGTNKGPLLPPVAQDRTEAYYFSQYVQYVDKVLTEENENAWAHGDSGFHTDEVCFLCKDGGDLVECDYSKSNCLVRNLKGSGVHVTAKCRKVYHEYCLAYTVPEEKAWFCPRHYCDGCGSMSLAHVCKYCPVTFCAECMSKQTVMAGYSQLQAPKYGWEFEPKAQLMCCGTCVHMFECCDQEGHPIVPSNPKKARPMHPVLEAPFLETRSISVTGVLSANTATVTSLLQAGGRERTTKGVPRAPPVAMSTEMQSAITKATTASSIAAAAALAPPAEVLSFDMQYALKVAEKADLAEERAQRAQARQMAFDTTTSSSAVQTPKSHRSGSGKRSERNNDKERRGSGTISSTGDGNLSSSTSAATNSDVNAATVDLTPTTTAENVKHELTSSVYQGQELPGPQPSYSTGASANIGSVNAANSDSGAQNSKAQTLKSKPISDNSQTSNMLQDVLAHSDPEAPRSSGLTFRIPIPATPPDNEGYSSYL
jgi:hypothetical protein